MEYYVYWVEFIESSGLKLEEKEAFFYNYNHALEFYTNLEVVAKELINKGGQTILKESSLETDYNKEGLF